MKKEGNLVISLDFELYWGVKDSRSIDSPYLEQIKRVKKVIPRLLDLFEKYQVKATFATVGMLFADSFTILEKTIPNLLPSYKESSFSPYSQFEKFKQYSEEYFFAPNLIQQIQERGIHEIASHTYSHYYCLEEGQNLEQFKADLHANNRIAKEKGIILKSLIFPRNQFNHDYLQICKDLGYTSVRSTEKGWMYKATNQKGNKLLKRGAKLLDSYLNLSGDNTYDKSELKTIPILEIPSSCFLRPYNKKLKFFDVLRLYRITSSMTIAAKKKKIYHLWWHPHNMAVDMDENFTFLEKILQHYKKLNEQYNFTSLTMHEITEK
jgi:peptidoglycan/xylan/chitin deacetylase (PgdA/CDA1 family)